MRVSWDAEMGQVGLQIEPNQFISFKIHSHEGWIETRHLIQLGMSHRHNFFFFLSGKRECLVKLPINNSRQLARLRWFVVQQIPLICQWQGNKRTNIITNTTVSLSRKDFGCSKMLQTISQREVHLSWYRWRHNWIFFSFSLLN